MHLAPELQNKIDKLLSESGLSADELVEDALAAYVTEVAETREMLDSRYDDLKGGGVKPITRDEIVAHFQQKSAIARRKRRGS